MSNPRLEVQIGANVTELKSKLKSVESTFKSLGAKLNNIGKTMTTRVTLPIVGMGVAMIKTAGDFEQSMNKVSAISGAVGTDFDMLRNKAKELGATTSFSASQAAEGMSFLAMAGFEAKEIVSAMPGVLNLAAAGNMDLATSADIASNILTGFGMTAEESNRMVDILAKTFTSSNTNLIQLGEAMKYVAPVAHGFGVSVEETAAIVGMLSDAGIQSSMAGTTLRNIINTLRDASEELGFSMHDANGAMLPMADILERLTEKTGGAQQAMDIFGLRAGPGLIALLDQGSERLRSFSKDLEDSGGTAQKIADKQLEGFKGALIELRSAVEGLFIELADTGVLKGLEDAVDRVTKFVRGFSSATDEQKKNFLKLMAVIALAGPTLIGLSIAFTGIASAIALISSPITGVILGIAGLVGALFYLRDNQEAVVERISDWNWWRNMLISMVQFLAQIVGKIYEFWFWLGESIIKLFSGVLSDIVKAFARMAVKVVDILKGIAKGAGTLLSYIPWTQSLAGGLTAFGELGTEGTRVLEELAENGTTFFENFKFPEGLNFWNTIAEGLEDAKGEQTEYNKELKTLNDYLEEAKKLLAQIFGISGATGETKTEEKTGETATSTDTVNEGLAKQKTFLQSILEIFPNLIESMKSYILGFTDGLAQIIMYGGKVEDILKDIAKQMASKALSKLFELFLFGGATGGLGSIFGGFFGGGGGVLGNVFPKIFGASAVSAGAMVPALSGQNVMVGGQFQLKGTDLVASITKTQNSILR